MVSQGMTALSGGTSRSSPWPTASRWSACPDPSARSSRPGAGRSGRARTRVRVAGVATGAISRCRSSSASPAEKWYPGVSTPSSSPVGWPGMVESRICWWRRNSRPVTQGSHSTMAARGAVRGAGRPGHQRGPEAHADRRHLLDTRGAHRLDRVRDARSPGLDPVGVVEGPGRVTAAVVREPEHGETRRGERFGQLAIGQVDTPLLVSDRGAQHHAAPRPARRPGRGTTRTADARPVRTTGGRRSPGRPRPTRCPRPPARWPGTPNRGAHGFRAHGFPFAAVGRIDGRCGPRAPPCRLTFGQFRVTLDLSARWPPPLSGSPSSGHGREGPQPLGRLTAERPIPMGYRRRQEEMSHMGNGRAAEQTRSGDAA